MPAHGLKIYPNKEQLDQALDDPKFPSRLTTWDRLGNESGPVLQLSADATHYGYVQSKALTIECSSGEFELQAGMYFSVPGQVRLRPTGCGFCASRLDYQGFFSLGGPIESQGRLRYIDGCSDSLLIGPVIMGDPCLNLLFLPPHTTQTEHTHPSCRAGIIVDGSGICRAVDATIRLHPGMIFEIPPDVEHSFHTSDSSLRVIAWHPDSDCGPAHDDHPMINRTMINGVSAANRSLNN